MSEMSVAPHIKPSHNHKIFGHLKAVVKCGPMMTIEIKFYSIKFDVCLFSVCEDQLGNCALAVQARLCHYKYYIQNCCNSCYGR